MTERRFWRLPTADAAALARAAGVPDPGTETLDALASRVTGALGRLHHALTIGPRWVDDGFPRKPGAIRDDARKLADALQGANLLARRLVLDMALPREMQEAIVAVGVTALHLRDKLDAEAKGRPRREPDAINDFLAELVAIYEHDLDRVAGRSRDPVTGAPGGPLLAFVRAVLDQAKARGITVPLTDLAIDRRLERLLSGERVPRRLIIGTLWPPDD